MNISGEEKLVVFQLTLKFSFEDHAMFLRYFQLHVCNLFFCRMEVSTIDIESACRY